MDLSFIIPAFNASETIESCLNSIYSLLGDASFETIVIDDCSSDDTVLVLNKYASTHPNLSIITQKENKRQGAARNKGISRAQGDYIAFVDADDFIKKDGILNALHAVRESDADICYFDFIYEQPKGHWTLSPLPNELRNRVLTSQEYLNKYYTTSYNGPCRTLYRTSFIKSIDIRFVEGVRWEDCDWTVKVYSLAKTIQFVDGVGYCYAYNENSTSYQNSVTAMAERVFAGLRLLEFSKDVQQKLPGLAQTIYVEGRYAYVLNTIRLRNLTKYAATDIFKLRNVIGRDNRNRLLAFRWPIWESLFLKNGLAASLILFFACPIAHVVRAIIKYIR